VQGTELLDHEEQEDDHGPAGIQEILPPLPQAHAAQRGEIRKRAKRAIIALAQIASASHGAPRSFATQK
jgi:hypothetical protein